MGLGQKFEFALPFSKEKNLFFEKANLIHHFLSSLFFMPRSRKNKPTSSYISDNKVKLIRGGAAYFELLEKIIGQARDTIHLQVYIYDEDETGKKIAEALIAAAKRKVKVYLLVDGYASQSLSPAFIQHLADGGVNFRFFDPLFKGNNFYFGRRLHHKIVVVDTDVAMVGGINISNHYNDTPGEPAWLDFALFTEGPIVKELCVLCWKTWKGFKADQVVAPCNQKSLKLDIKPDEIADVRLRQNDWVRRKNQISKTYIEIMVGANSHISILCSYFLPGSVMRRAIKKAVKRGVKIKVIMAGKSDLVIAKNAERYMYDWLLRHKVEIYEYQNNILHGKIAVSDCQWMTIGSYNVNDISAYASIELNLDIKNPSFSTHVSKTLDEIISNDCTMITAESHSRTKNILKQFFRWASFELFRLGFHVFTFYFRQTN
ncbi:MAG: cardiolipin synthase ClsB [Ferruginibacter sp.]